MEDKTMARPIAETPILYGETGRRFEARMNEPRYESAAEKADRIAAYNLISSLVVNWGESAVEQPTKAMFFDLNDIEKEL